MITRYGYDVVLTVTAIAVIGIIASCVFLHNPLIKYAIIGFLTIFVLFTLYFFRDPSRTIPDGDNLILSPADGKLVQIKNLENDDYLGAPAIQLSIFLSPLNVHVNRIPWSGTVTHFRYIRGKFMVAYDHEASEKNERTEIGIERDGKRILIKQIVGSIARRIVCPLKEGDTVIMGERFGMIRFGSRMDVIIPKDAVIKTEVGDKVVGGETLLAVMPD